MTTVSRLRFSFHTPRLIGCSGSCSAIRSLPAVAQPARRAVAAMIPLRRDNVRRLDLTRRFPDSCPDRHDLAESEPGSEEPFRGHLMSITMMMQDCSELTQCLKARVRQGTNRAIAKNFENGLTEPTARLVCGSKIRLAISAGE